MKKLLFGLTLLASMSSFANEGHVSGIVKQMECDSREGKGIVELETMEGDTIVSSWYKVDSGELCSPTENSLMFLGKTSKLGALSAENTGLNSSGNGNYTTFITENGMIVEIEKNEKVAFEGLYDGAKHSVRENVAEAHKWYYGEVKGMDTSNWPDN
ncbi:MAG: hypothetical protein ACJAS4_001470 [Bacteriovoracaceae bacterium]|jgi:hypothetical protein